MEPRPYSSFEPETVKQTWTTCDLHGCADDGDGRCIDCKRDLFDLYTEED